MPPDLTYTLPIHLLLFSVNLPVQTPDILYTKLHTYFPSHSSLQRIRSSLTLCVTFRNMLELLDLRTTPEVRDPSLTVDR
jgi:hypothetical protein